MADLARARELIQKYLDDLLTAEETGELERILQADPEAARLFSRLARTDSFIYAHFNKCRAEETVRIELARDTEAPAAARGTLWPGRPAPLRGARLQNVLDHLWGPVGAIALHAVLIVLLLRWAVVETLKRGEEYEVLYSRVENLNLDKLPLPPPPLDNTPIELPVAVPPVEIPGLAGASSGGSSEGALGDGIGVGLGTEPGSGPADAPGIEVASVPGPLILKDLGYGTRSPGGKAEALSKYNPAWGAQTEASVVKALEWLTRKQLADGSWGPNKIAMTGLALLTFLAHGETTSSPKYGPTVEKALRFLSAQQDADGYFSRSRGGGGDGGDPTSYAHAIATYGVCEAYGLTRIASLKPVMEKAVQVILDGQQPKGGWNYRFSKSARRDTSVSGWMIQAVKSAQIGGAENPGLKSAMAAAVADLKSVHNAQNGRFGYTDSGGGSLGCTGIGVLCMQLLGHAADRETRQGLQALREATVDWREDREQGWPLYEWYYITQANFHQGGQTWRNWNAQFAREYTRRQNADGSWPPASKAEASYGPVYSTTLAALTLQVYYRFLPTYQTNAIAPAAPAATNDVSVEIL